jgi:hypothetical protein
MFPTLVPAILKFKISPLFVPLLTIKGVPEFLDMCDASPT